jgi:cell division protease FtsH
MVTQYGMTEKLGAIKLGTSDSAPFLGRDYGHQRDYSESIAGAVDQEIRELIETAHQEAFDILTENRKILDELVITLLEKETLGKEEIAEIFAQVRGPAPRGAWTGSATRKPSTLPPVEILVRTELQAEAEGVVEEKPKRRSKKSAPKSE